MGLFTNNINWQQLRSLGATLLIVNTFNCPRLDLTSFLSTDMASLVQVVAAKRHCCPAWSASRTWTKRTEDNFSYTEGNLEIRGSGFPENGWDTCHK